MAVGTLVLAWLLAAPPGSADVVPINNRMFNIPIRFDESRRHEIKELILFTSADQGKTWQQVAVANPEQGSFPFIAPTDGIYWFSVCVVDQKGHREPADIYKVPPSQKILVDTLRPLLRIVSADRQGEDIVVSWEIQEDNPDLASLKLEYRTPDAPGNFWYNAPLTPALKGQGRFHPPNPGPVSIRMQVQDVAENKTSSTAEVAASTGTTSALAASAPPPLPPMPLPAAPAPAPVSAWDNTRPNPPLVPLGNEPRLPADPSPVVPASNYQLAGPPNGEPGKRLLATSEAAPPVPAAVPTPNGLGLSKGQLPPKSLVNSRQVMLNYTVSVGPSGIGKVALWMTKDDGHTWAMFKEDPVYVSPMTVDLPEDGMYGFILVVQSRAGKAKPNPIGGDLPEIRVEVDTTKPTANLYGPVLDPSQPEAVILTWEATDRNLGDSPVTLQWADHRDAPTWQTIKAGLPGTGRFPWKLPERMPCMIFLKVIAQDQAGNVAEAITEKPVCIDLKEPEARLLSVAASPRRP